MTTPITVGLEIQTALLPNDHVTPQTFAALPPSDDDTSTSLMRVLTNGVQHDRYFDPTMEQS